MDVLNFDPAAVSGDATTEVEGYEDHIEEIEQATGKPVVTSNQSMMWNCLRMAGIEDRLDGYGILFRDH